jgi:hypothetical protein
MIPDALREQLQLLLEHQPMIKQIISHLPRDLQRVAGTPEGLLALLLTAAVGLLVLLALAGSSKGKKGSSIVLAGPMNAGKSTLYYQLVDGSQHNGLVASMEQNAGGAALCSVASKASSSIRSKKKRVLLRFVQYNGSVVSYCEPNQSSLGMPLLLLFRSASCLALTSQATFCCNEPKRYVYN